MDGLIIFVWLFIWTLYEIIIDALKLTLTQKIIVPVIGLIFVYLYRPHIINDLFIDKSGGAINK